MRGLTSAELRTEKFQNLTFLGLVADDVSLAVMHYPELNSVESQAVVELVMSLEPLIDASTTSIRCAKSMGDPLAILQEAAEANTKSATSDEVRAVLASLRFRLEKVTDKSASADDLAILREFTERLAKITLMLTQSFATERGARDWMPKVSDSFVAS